MARIAIVLDANILIRFALGRHVQRLLEGHAATVDFLAPDTAFVEARRSLLTILRARSYSLLHETVTLAALDIAEDILTTVPASSYEPLRPAAWARIGLRDPDDWPVLACALLLNCPVWTEDRDFFGTGVATWTTALVELYFTDPDPSSAEH